MSRTTVLSRTPVFVALLLAAAGAAASLRLPGIGRRPMHTDEAVHTVKCDELRRTGRYEYDPHDYHGPTLYYATLPILWLAGSPAYAETTAAMYRLVPAIVGIALVLLVLLVVDAIGRPATLAAAWLTALSPALVFFSRYYIQETLLLFFTLLLIGGGWRYWRDRRWAWLVVAGVAAGGMHATKETCLIAWAGLAIGTGALLVASKERRRGGRAILAGAAVAVIVSVALFSVGFTNWGNVGESVRTWTIYPDRAAGNLHVHPSDFFLRLLAWNRAIGGRVWSEGFILLLGAFGASAGVVGGWWARSRGLGQRSFALILGIYTILLFVAYSAIPYKTPWSILGALHGAVLLAGVGAAALWQAMKPAAGRAILGVLFIAGTGHLAWQSWRINHVFDPRADGPFAYGATVPDVEHLADRLERLAGADPAGHAMLIRVVAPNPWPLPWYLRRFSRVGYWETVPPEEDFDADVVLVSYALADELSPRLRGRYHVSSAGLRRDEVLWAYVRRDLWDRLWPPPG